MKAAGAYLWELREARALSREAVADAIGTNDVQIMRIEKGTIDTRGSLLLKFVNVVAGDAELLKTLMVDDAASEEDGRRLARERHRLTGSEMAQVSEMRNRLGPETFQRAVEVVASLAERGLVESLIELQEAALDQKPQRSRRSRLPWRRSQSPETG